MVVENMSSILSSYNIKRIVQVFWQLYVVLKMILLFHPLFDLFSIFYFLLFWPTVLKLISVFQLYWLAFPLLSYCMSC